MRHQPARTTPGDGHPQRQLAVRYRTTIPIAAINIWQRHS
jgi:hypothetical protein